MAFLANLSADEEEERHDELKTIVREQLMPALQKHFDHQYEQGSDALNNYCVLLQDGAWWLDEERMTELLNERFKACSQTTEKVCTSIPKTRLR